jgi:hypothetical protein
MTTSSRYSEILLVELTTLIVENHETQLVDALFHYHKNDFGLFLTLQREILNWIYIDQVSDKSKYLALASLRAAKAPDLKVAGLILEKDLASSQKWYNDLNEPNINTAEHSSPCFDYYCKDNPEAVECKVFDL